MAATHAAASKTGGPGQTKSVGPGFFALRTERRRDAGSGDPRGGRRSSWPTCACPSPDPGEALVRVSVTGLCRTDLKIVRHGHRDLTLPRVPGEEVVGEIVALGPGAAAALRATRGRAAAPSPPFAPGDRVYVYPGVWCGECPSCRRGAENLCRQMRIMGFHRDGGFAEYVAAPLQSLIRVPEGLGDEEAVFAEPLSCCLNALELGARGRGGRAGRVGRRPGRHAPQPGRRLARRRGGGRRATRRSSRAACGGVRARRRRRACTRAAPGPVDVAVVAVGDPRAYEAAIAALAPRGRLVVFSGLLPADDAACTSASAPSTTTSTPSSAPTAAASATASRRSTSWPPAACASTTSSATACRWPSSTRVSTSSPAAPA